MALIVRKYGGSSLATPQQILDAAKQVAHLHRAGKKVIVVVSAMGKNTDTLMKLAQEISPTPVRRELDMLLTTGERISMSLMSMALHDLDCPAISFTGSQAGVLTNSTHSDATILNIKPIRVRTALDYNQVVVLAGFQGVDPKTKEVTTLGRGGSDTTAVAIASHFKAERCEILKDVSGILTADPKILALPRPLKEVTYDSLLDMCFWGSQVLHYRSAALAHKTTLPLYIGSSQNPERGTLIVKDTPMYESHKILSVHSHKNVHSYTCDGNHLEVLIDLLRSLIETQDLPWPQILQTTLLGNSKVRILLTAEPEELKSLLTMVKTQRKVHIENPDLSTVTMTAYGTVRSGTLQETLKELSESSIEVYGTIHSSLSLTFVVKNSKRQETIRILHKRTESESLVRKPTPLV